MNKRILLPVLVITITFIGGYFSGMHHNEQKKENLSPVKSQSLKGRQFKQLAKKQLPKSNKVLIGYVQDFRSPDSIDYSKFTHIIFSFAHPTKDGHVLLNGEMASNNLKTVVSYAHQHKKKAMLAVGGWYHIQGGESYKYFQPAISNSSSRTTLVNELVKLASSEQLDGIDIDFEHPHSQQDAKNLSLFIKELSEPLHASGKELSIAVHSKINSVSGLESHYVVYDPEMFQNTDYVNIMAYDGQYDNGYHAANLSPYPFTEKIVNYWSQLFDQYHINKERLVLGIPAYGQPENPAAKQVSYATILKNSLENAKQDKAELNRTTYYYNGETTVKRKTDLALGHGFGGMMIWEAGLDYQGSAGLTAVISNSIENNDTKGKVFNP